MSLVETTENLREIRVLMATRGPVKYYRISQVSLNGAELCVMLDWTEFPCRGIVLISLKL